MQSAISLPQQLATEAADMLQALGVTDTQCVQIFQTANTVLQTRSLISEAPNLIIDHEMQTVGLHYKVDTSYDEATDMLCELNQALLQKDLLNLPLIIAFQGVRK